jgi:hypothetical protein
MNDPQPPQGGGKSYRIFKRSCCDYGTKKNGKKAVIGVRERRLQNKALHLSADKATKSRPLCAQVHPRGRDAAVPIVTVIGFGIALDGLHSHQRDRGPAYAFLDPRIRY